MLSENGVTATITTNTLIHVLEAYTRFHQVTQDIKVKERLKFLVDTFKDKIWNKETSHMRVFFDADWKELLPLKSFGHDLEATWLYDLALKELSFDNDKNYSGFILDIGEKIMEEAVDQDGSLYNEAELNHVDKTRVWWCQIEGIVGFINLFTRTKDIRYREAAEDMWKYTMEELVDTREVGEWRYAIEAHGTISEKDVVEPWKTPYHNLRGCLEIVKRLEKVQI